MTSEIFIMIGDFAYMIITVAASLAMLACALESLRTQIGDILFNIYMRISDTKEQEENNDGQ